MAPELTHVNISPTIYVLVIPVTVSQLVAPTVTIIYSCPITKLPADIIIELNMIGWLTVNISDNNSVVTHVIWSVLAFAPVITKVNGFWFNDIVNRWLSTTVVT